MKELLHSSIVKKVTIIPGETQGKKILSESQEKMEELFSQSDKKDED